MWVQITAPKHLDVDGVQRTYQRGDWVDVGKQTAIKWLASGEAVSPVKARITVGKDCGVLLRGDSAGVRKTLARLNLALPIVEGDVVPPFGRTLIWDGSAALRAELLPVGFALLDTWEVAIPLASYDVLARDRGDAADREATAAVVHDLRCPVYDPRVLFARRSDGAERLVRLWTEERAEGGDAHLALLRAVYRAAPLVLALPPTWIAER